MGGDEMGGEHVGVNKNSNEPVDTTRDLAQLYM